MAFGAKAVLIVRTGGSDTNCGGGFNPGNANMATDLAATSGNTSAPVVTSASYNFVAGDVGARIFIQSGTSWYPGWYTIASVAVNAATLTASIASATGYNGTQASGINTTAGCAAVASPTGGVWSVDYSNKDAAQISYTDLVGVASTFTSVAFPVGKNIIGNYISVTAGTNYTVQRVEVVSTSTITATVDKTFGASATGAATAYLGGALASPGMAGGIVVAGNSVYVRTGTYTLGSASSNVATGTVLINNAAPSASNPNVWEGFGTIPGDMGTRPTITNSASTSITMFSVSGQLTNVNNLAVDGNAQSTVIGFAASGGFVTFYKCAAANCTSTAGISLTGTNCHAVLCSVTGCSGTAGFTGSGNTNQFFFGCEAYSNTTIGFSAAAASLHYCLSYANSGASSDGFAGSSSKCICCVAYNNGRHGFNISGNAVVLANCIAEGHAAGYGFTDTTQVDCKTYIINCGGYNNASGNINTTQLLMPTINFVTNTTGSFFANAGSGDFSLNNTTAQGKLARGTGFPGIMPRGLSTGATDIGAIQHADPVAASGGAFTFGG